MNYVLPKTVIFFYKAKYYEDFYDYLLISILSICIISLLAQ